MLWLLIFISKNLEIAEYAFDGLLVYGDFYQDKPFEMLQEMTDYVNDEFKDLNMVH
jgi:hypothetical protein